MSVQANNYDDFKIVANNLKSARTVFYADLSDRFEIFGFPDNQISGVRVTIGGAGAKPSTFDADFPHAIALSATLDETI